MNRDKVVFLISSSIAGGAQLLLLDLVKYIRDRLDMMIVCPAGYLSERLVENGFDPVVTEINQKTIADIRAGILTWAGNDPFVLNPMLFGTCYYVCKAFRRDDRCRIMSLLLNPIVREDLPFYKKIAYRYIAKVIGRHSDHIGVGSPELEAEVLSLTGKKPVYLENRVPNTQPPKQCFYDGSRPLKVCFVGRMAEQKRPDLFVQTAAITTSRQAKIEYYMAGEGHLLEQVKQYICDHDLQQTVHLIGFQQDLYGFLGQMDVLLLTSEFENTPLIMLNAMNASLPIVCGNVEGVTHLIDNRQNGVITEAYSPEAFAAALMELANDAEQVKNLSVQAYQKATHDFSYDKFVQTYVSVLEHG